MASVISIFTRFFVLGWVSFGGPAAHIGYFRHTFVAKLKWLEDKDYAQIVALSQFLPGPGSSQVGFAVGYLKGGLPGAIAAFLGFTLPSILLMLALALLSDQLTGASLFHSIIHGLKLLAVVVVADATLGMFGSFCKQKLSVALCAGSAMVLLVIPGVWVQMAILMVAALIGQHWLQGNATPGEQKGRISIIPLLLFVVLLFGLPLLASRSPELSLFADFYQAGSLVFGGGHVVLPLLQGLVGDQLPQDAFLTGYATAQAVPGPMFTLATYIGYQLLPGAPIAGALLATVAVFLPGFLLLLGVLDNWQMLAGKSRLSGAVNGVNAAVVGLLLSALYQPVFSSAVASGLDMALVIAGFWLLKSMRLHIVWLLGFFVFSGVATGLLP